MGETVRRRSVRWEAYRALLHPAGWTRNESHVFPAVEEACGSVRRKQVVLWLVYLKSWRCRSGNQDRADHAH